MLRIGLAALEGPKSVLHGVEKIDAALTEASRQGVEIVCFPETYLPGLRGNHLDLPEPDQPLMERALDELCQSCRTHGVAAIVGMEWLTDLGLENRAFVISGSGDVLGHQTKNQITPGGESANYVPDGRRQLFEIGDTCFGIVICHEGWRYPETVRWAAVRGAQIVFQPQVTGNRRGIVRETWGEHFYERAMLCRAEENSIYFASVNVVTPYQNSATSLIGPDGKLIEYVPYGEEKVLVADIDLEKATRFYARRYNPDWYPDQPVHQLEAPLPDRKPAV